MKISDIKTLLNAEVLCGENNLSHDVFSACGSDIRTAEMMDMVCIVFVRSKRPTPDMIELARENGLVLMATDKRMYEACGLLYKSGLVGNGVRHE